MKRGLFGSLIFGLLFAPIGFVVAFYFGKPILDDAKASTHWPSVEGVVQRSEVTTSRNSDNKTMYSAQVVYSYTVDGREFENDTVSFGGKISTNSSRYARNVTNRYPVGRQVRVHYEPAAPANAVLEPGVTWRSYIVFAVGIAFLLVGLLMVAGPLGSLAFGAFVVAGAASGAIGRRKSNADYRPSELPHNEAPPNRPPSPPPQNPKDDGFDIG